MRIVVAGATGRVGQLTCAVLEGAGHRPVPVSRRTNADVYTGAGLAAAMQGADVVVDVLNISSRDQAEIVDFFGTTTRNLLAAGDRAGVRHHILLSIVGIDHGQPVAHYAGKREQERLVTEGPVPWSVVRATQFHDFAAMVAGWAEQDGVATIAPLLLQPIAPADVATVLAEIATAAPLHAKLDVAGPETQDLVDMARRTFAVRGQDVKLVPTWRGIFGLSMAGEVLLPGAGARLTSGTFAAWLAGGARLPADPGAVIAGQPRSQLEAEPGRGNGGRAGSGIPAPDSAAASSEIERQPGTFGPAVLPATSLTMGDALLTLGRG